MRPVRVTRPAPMSTPSIPNRGRVDIADGIAAAVARAISAGVGGRAVIAAEAMVVGYRFVRTVAVTERPGRSLAARLASSSPIFTGTRCTTLVKFPVALSGGNNANCDPLAGAISITLP